MEQKWILVALPLAAFVIAWALASWRAQRNQQQLHTDVEVTRSSLEQAKAELALQATQIAQLSEQKAALDIAYGRLETDRDNNKDQIAKLDAEITTHKTELKRAQQSEQVARESNSKAQETAAKLQEQIASNVVTFTERLSERDQQREKLETQLSSVEAQLKHTATQLGETRELFAQVQAQLQEKQNELSNYKAWWEATCADLKAANEKYAALENAHVKLNTSFVEKQQSFDAQFKQLNENRESLTKEFERLANEVLERKGKAFKELNQESINNLIAPLQTEMKGFRSRIEDIHTKDAEQRVELRTELKNLQVLNKDITDQAEKLTTALRGQKKVQGNWGELMLENVLDSSGLRLGTDYKREVSFNTEDGRQRPDAIVYLPQNKHMIIDAKTSLVAYTDYINAEDDLVRAQALAAHTAAVSARINELADRDYHRLAGLNSPEVVIMFIPIESAYVEALRHDESLFQRAIERNILVATPTTLLTSLKIVKQLWSFEDRNKHTAELASRAQKFYEKLNGFLTSMQAVGTQLDKAKETYSKALGQLYNGKGNLIKQASEFRELGVSVQKELPGELLERAKLELEGDIALAVGEGPETPLIAVS
ncbi:MULTISPECIES: DNA recombination protein RmuC [Pseudomonas]|uniref:DNA recombination protein RmuC n=1 Tax=Pseudomonas TaxID=286 RepID=UPI0019807F75|nr:DNA recombination protein RmuC [Pseudomonas arsenicoxydans]